MRNQDWHLANIHKALELLDSGRASEGQALLQAGKHKAQNEKDETGDFLYDLATWIFGTGQIPSWERAERPANAEPGLVAVFAAMTDLLTERSLGAPPQGPVEFLTRDHQLSLVRALELFFRRRQESRQEAERAAREQRIKLEAWRSLSARSAHRIGNQLFASLGALRTLRELNARGTAEPIADIQASLERMSMIVQEFQRFAVNEKPNTLPTDLRPLLNDLVRRYQVVAGNVEIATELPDGLPMCQVDRNQIDQGFGELLENALHHTPPGGRIQVRAAAADSPQGQKVVVTVEDSGPGVTAANKPRLFEAFFSTRPGGSGLGLAIVKQIVENHGGRIRETGTPGKGGRFEVELPAAPTQENQP